MSKSVIIIGCGDIGKRFAALASRNGFEHIYGTTRTPEHTDKLATSGITPILANLDDPTTLATIPTADATLLYCAPPPGGGFQDSRARNFCHALAAMPRPTKIIYISTTAVYGDNGDELITELTPPAPATSRGRRRLDAEETFQQFGRDHHVPVTILRVAGIYGPGRLPLQQLRSNHPVLIPAEAKPTNRIHADDLATICLAAAERGVDQAIYNVCDGHPGTLTEYFTAAAALLGFPAPPQITLAEAHKVMTPLMLTYVREGHRISNRKILDELGVTLTYPTLAKGLANCRPTDWLIPA